MQQILISITSELKYLSPVLGKCSQLPPFAPSPHSPPFPILLQVQGVYLCGQHQAPGASGFGLGLINRQEVWRRRESGVRCLFLCLPPRVVTLHLHGWQLLWLPRGLIRHSSLLCGFPTNPSLPPFKPRVVSSGLLPQHQPLCVNKSFPACPIQVCYQSLVRSRSDKGTITRQTWSVWGSRHCLNQLWLP